MEKLKKIIPIIIPPLGVLMIMLIVFNSAGLYPFGQGSVSWCDMNQQTIPLLINFKDILDGKGSIFLNMNNAAGMNFYGVFFFFLASPFSFLVKFVDKCDMYTFANILVILKMMTASVTSMLYFRLCKKNLHPGFAVILSLMYAFCGYGMLFYQNIIWLDMMYLFPVLMISLHILEKKQNNILYIATLIAMLVVNYYISYMVVVFIIVFMFVYVFRNAKENSTPLICTKFISGSVIAALASAVVWLPCFIQYLSSGRGESAIETISRAKFITRYKSIIPLLFCTAFVFVIIGYNALSRRKPSKRSDTDLILFGLVLLPFFVEPINLVWHTGNYMSFPARYGFITIFIGLICCGNYLGNKNHEIKTSSNTNRIIAFLFAGFICYLYMTFSQKYVENNFEKLTSYTQTLWGSDGSFDGLARLFVATLICYVILYFMYRHGLLRKELFMLFICAIFVFEAASNMNVYMTSTYKLNPTRTQSFKNIADLSDRIEDDDFYRVATNAKIMDYNMIGALGYPSLSHYTSLTDKDFMFTQKRLGYTTVWMQTGSSGGTELTDALYSVKYRIINSGNINDPVYANDNYSIVKTPYTFGLGLLTDKDLKDCEIIPPTLTRTQVQEYVYSSIFGDDEKLITPYNIDENESTSIEFSNGKFNINPNSKVVYNFYVEGKQSIYADCFDRLSNDLEEEYFDSLSISVNGIIVQSNYPTKSNNGVHKLGEFENEKVEVVFNVKEKISCYSFGVFGLDLDVMNNAVANATSINFNEDCGKLEATANLEKPQTCFLTVPYGNGFVVKVNGEKVDHYKALSNSIAFELPEGESNIEISFAPKGFYLGLTITIIGIAAFVLYIIFRKKLVVPEKVQKTIQSITIVSTYIAIGVIYILPVILNLCSKI